MTLKGCTPTLEELSNLLGAKLKGDPRTTIGGIATLDKARAGELSFLTSPHYRKFLGSTKASAVIVSPSDVVDCATSLLVSDNPRLALAKVAKLFEKPKTQSSGIHPSAIIADNCRIAKSVAIGPNVVIGAGSVIGDEVIIGAGSTIGENCRINAKTVLMAKVTLYNNVQIGERCLLHSGAVLGSDGFGYAMDGGTWVKMPHLGSVVLGNRVEIGANTTIDRGFLEDTEIGDGVIIDNLVQIGHNVTIGMNTAIAACVGIAGSTHIGANCMIGGGACIAGHIEIVDNVYLTATSSVNHSLNKAGTYSSGLPVKPNHVWRKNVARFQYLDAMARRIRVLEKQLSNEEQTEGE